MSEFTLRIDGMHCGACVRRVSQALAGEGLDVKEVRVGAARVASDQDLFPAYPQCGARSPAAVLLRESRAAGVMAFSSVSVLGNSLRLRG